MSRYNIKVPTKEEIYSKEGSTISSLARFYKTSNPTVRSWLIMYNIERKSHKQASIEANNRHRSEIVPTKEELKSLYETNSIKFIEKFYSVSQQTVYEWLNLYDIELKNLNDAVKISKQKTFEHIQFSKEYLLEQYDREKPLSLLAEKLNVSHSHIKKLFKLHTIDVEPSWRSKAEIELYEYCKETFNQYEWKNNVKNVIPPYELDIYNPDLNMAIEYCGNMWHSENFGEKLSSYHKMKYMLCAEKGVKLITIFESDDMTKIKNLLNTIHRVNDKIYARKTSIRQIDSKEAKEFHISHHINNSVGSKYNYGLFYENKLVMVASFGKSRYNKKYEYECTRMSSHSEYTIVGGASKLFKNFIETIKPNGCITYADLRFGSGSVYLNCGFKFEGYTSPNYWYFHRNNATKLFSRVKFQKHKLYNTLETFDSSKTEFQNMIANKWDRIWDCGNAIYTYK